MTRLARPRPPKRRCLDCRGWACPGPLLEVKRVLPEIGVGEVLEVLVSDPETLGDLPAWAGNVGHEHLGTFSAGGYARLLLRRVK